MPPLFRHAPRALAGAALATLIGTAFLLDAPCSAAGAPFTGGNILVSTGDKVYELTRTGELVQAIPVYPYAPGPHAGATDMVVDRDGNLHLLNSTSYPPTLDSYNPVTRTWRVRVVPGTQGASVYYRIATRDRYLYVPIHSFGSVYPAYYIVRIDLEDDSTERFPQPDVIDTINVGLDGLLYAEISDASFSSHLLSAFDPLTLSTSRSFYAPDRYSAIAADARGEIFALKYYSHDFLLSHLAADGTPIKTVTLDAPNYLVDVDVCRDGAVVVGTYGTGTLFLTNESLDSPKPLLVPGQDARFVAFVPCKEGDSDCDDVTDAQEAALGTDPANRDSDGDGLVDGEEVNFYHSDPLVTDTDGDGLSDDREVRVTNTDPTRVDTDGDGLSDPQEIDTYHTDPLKADTDGDGLDDGDELAAHTDPLKPDTDGDGLTDGREVHDVHTDPLLADTDGDGLSDLEELQDGTSPLIADTDGDGLSDYEEIRVWGTNPRSRTISYLLPGSATASVGGISQSIPVTELLFLSADRNYVIGAAGTGAGQQGVPERGVWFRSQGRLFFYQQNLFDALRDLADALRPQLGSVPIILRSNSRSAAMNERSGVLSLRGAAAFTFLRSGAFRPIGVTFSDRGSGSFSEIPVPEPTSIEGSPAAASAPAFGAVVSQLAVVPSTAWSVMGTLTTRTGKTTEVHAISGSLLLKEDQTFDLDPGAAETPMRGMWFQDGNRMLLYPQNLLEQTLALERRLAVGTGEPVRVELLQVRDEGRSDSRTGFLLLTLAHRHAASLTRSGQLLPVSSTWTLTATPAP